LVVIGHGLSPLGKGWGPEIDKHDVVRLKDPSWQKPGDYGGRVDYMAASTETLGVMSDYRKVPKEYWGFPKKGTFNQNSVHAFESKAKAPVLIKEFPAWVEEFKKTTEVNNFSLGIFAVLCCLDMGCKSIHLVGFDNLLDPMRWEYHKANRGKWVSFHDWPAERKLLDRMMTHYEATWVSGMT